MLMNGLKNIIKRSPIVFIGMIIYLFIVFLCLEFLFINIFDIYKYTGETFQQVNDNQYRLVDMADTSSLIRDYDSVINLKSFYNDLNNSNNYALYEGILQPTSITAFKGNETFYYGYEDNQSHEKYIVNTREYVTIKQVLINYNKLLASNIEDNIIIGRSFTSDDFLLKDYDRIPIILGYDYNEYYKIGDVINGILIQDLECTYEVVGILDKDISIIINSELIFLDRYILSPSLTIESVPKSYSDLMYQGFSYLQKINGVIELTDNYTMKDFIIELEKLRLRYNIFDIAILNYSIVQINALKFLVYENAQTLFLIFILTLVFNLITLFSYMLYKIKLNKYFYKVYLLSGYGVKDIKRIIYLEVLIPVSVSLLLVIFFLNIYMEDVLMLSLAFIGSVFVLINAMSFILTNILFNKINLEMLAEGEEND